MIIIFDNTITIIIINTFRSLGCLSALVAGRWIHSKCYLIDNVHHLYACEEEKENAEHISLEVLKLQETN